ncbi:hypothetical protein HMPREF0083_02622 [Aneurinibacillus aneurinilyticus ATCC 12856]|jgi:hypothetical protein|uniref:YtkA-like domain-containing protein n=2 Tax=Aneurinibacillus aneurinilyticus TaxID=1391 RepID=U1X485_ANEAE|nr:hypothetical protein HMPREF0083_02622 [Aneurinibacillus aneurinilyticus ATCC 12856]
MNEGEKKMKRYRNICIGWIMPILLLILAGCGGEKQPEERKVPEKLQAQYTASSASPQVGQEVTFSVSITQGEEKVNDAEAVKFEIWREGQKEKHAMVPAKKTGDGVYSIAQSFKEPGTYYVMYHIDARGLHSMAKHKISVE